MSQIKSRVDKAEKILGVLTQKRICEILLADYGENEELPEDIEYDHNNYHFHIRHVRYNERTESCGQHNHD